MKRLLLYKIVFPIVVFLSSTGMISEGNVPTIKIPSEEKNNNTLSKELLYDNVWGTIYNPEIRQCDNTPTVTGDGSKINPKKASKLRWIAISQNMLDCKYRQKFLTYKRSDLYKGKIRYGDTVWIESPYKEINGWWIVRDTKNARYKNSIDFLQTKGDCSLYKNYPNWSGKFNNIKIYRKHELRRNT